MNQSINKRALDLLLRQAWRRSLVDQTRAARARSAPPRSGGARSRSKARGARLIQELGAR